MSENSEKLPNHPLETGGITNDQFRQLFESMRDETDKIMVLGEMAEKKIFQEVKRVFEELGPSLKAICVKKPEVKEDSVKFSYVIDHFGSKWIYSLTFHKKEGKWDPFESTPEKRIYEDESSKFNTKNDQN